MRIVTLIITFSLACLNSFGQSPVHNNFESIMNEHYNGIDVSVCFKPISKDNCDTLSFKLYVFMGKSSDSICKFYYEWEDPLYQSISILDKTEKVKFDRKIISHGDMYAICIPAWLGSELIIVRYTKGKTEILNHFIHSECGFIFYENEAIIAVPERRAFYDRKTRLYKITSKDIVNCSNIISPNYQFDIFTDDTSKIKIEIFKLQKKLRANK